MKDRGSFFTSARLPFATAGLATGIFIADTVTRVDIAVPVLYVAVVLLSARFCRPSGVRMVAAGCAALTILSYVITRNTGPLIEGTVNALISLGAIAVVTPLVLRAQSREFALRRREAYLAEAQRLTHTGSWAYEPNSGKTTYWSEEEFRVFGLDPQQGLPTNQVFWERIHPDDRDTVNAGIQKVFRERAECVLDYRILLPDGTLKHIHSVSHPVVSRSGDVLELVGTAVDVTERRLAEEALRRSEAILRQSQEKYSSMVRSSPDAITLRSLPDRRYLEVNEGFERLTGYTAEDVLGKTSAELNLWVDPEFHRRTLQLVETQAHVNGLEFRFRTKTGEVRYGRVSAAGVTIGGEQCILAVTHDITDRKRAESLLAGEKHILEMVAKGDSLDQILEALCGLVEEQVSGALASILLLDGDRLRRGAAPSLPKAYTEAIDEAAIGPLAGFSGTAAYRGEQVIVEDIASDASWANNRDMASYHSLRACWATPVFSSQAKVIATFAMYYREPRSPSPQDQELIEQISHLAGVVIERNLTQEALRRSEAHLAEAQRLTHTGSWARTPNGDAYWSEEMFRIWGFD